MTVCLRCTYIRHRKESSKNILWMASFSVVINFCSYALRTLSTIKTREKKFIYNFYGQRMDAMIELTHIHKSNFVAWSSQWCMRNNFYPFSHGTWDEGLQHYLWKNSGQPRKKDSCIIIHMAILLFSHDPIPHPGREIPICKLHERDGQFYIFRRIFLCPVSAGKIFDTI